MTNETVGRYPPLPESDFAPLHAQPIYTALTMFAYLDADRAQRATADEALLRQALDALDPAVCRVDLYLGRRTAEQEKVERLTRKGIEKLRVAIRDRLSQSKGDANVAIV